MVDISEVYSKIQITILELKRNEEYIVSLLSENKSNSKSKIIKFEINFTVSINQVTI